MARAAEDPERAAAAERYVRALEEPWRVSAPRSAPGASGVNAAALAVAGFGHAAFYAGVLGSAAAEMGWRFASASVRLLVLMLPVNDLGVPAIPVRPLTAK